MTSVSPSDDEADVRCVLAGDLSAFERIVRRWEGPLVNLAYRFCREHGRAEDMAQEAFLKVFRALPTWRRESAFSTWLFSVATNVYRTELRRMPTGMVPLADLPEPAALDGHRAEMEEADRDRILRRTVLALPEKYRDVTVLFYFHEMDVSRAASTLGLPEGTVKTRLARAREILRAKLPHLLGLRSTKGAR